MRRDVLWRETFGEEKAKEGRSEVREAFCEEIRFESGEKAKVIRSKEKEIRSEEERDTF